jgi:hypothetical protein
MDMISIFVAFYWYVKLYWTYYGKLLQFKLDPSQENAEKLSAEFDALVSTKTNYEALNELIN